MSFGHGRSLFRRRGCPPESDLNGRVNRYVPRLEQLECRTVPSIMVTQVTELAVPPSAANALFGLLTPNQSLQPQVESTPTSSVMLTEQPTYQIKMLEPVAAGGLALYVSVPASSDGSLANSVTLSFNGCPVSTIPAGGSAHVSQVQVALTAQSGYQSDSCVAMDVAWTPGIMVMVSQNASSSMSAVTLTLAAVKLSSGRVGIFLAVAAGDSVDERVILLEAVQAAPPPAQPPQNFPTSVPSVVDTPATRPSEPPNKGFQNTPSKRVSEPRLPIQVLAQFHGSLAATELPRRASTPAAYVTWSGRDDPAPSQKPAAAATSATADDDVSTERTIAPAYAASPPLALQAKTDADSVAVHPRSLTTVVGPVINTAWAAEANVARQILPEDEPLDAPSSPRRAVQRVRNRASVRGIAFLAISVTATWFFGHDYGDLLKSRLVSPRRTKTDL